MANSDEELEGLGVDISELTEVSVVRESPEEVRVEAVCVGESSLDGVDSAGGLLNHEVLQENRPVEGTK